MNLNSTRFYSYVFFKVSSVSNRENEQASHFFERWKIAENMEEKSPTQMPGDMELKMLRLAQTETAEICLFRFRDIDIFKFRKHRTEGGEAVSSFWEKTAGEFESRMSGISESFSFIGTCQVYFAHSSDLSKNAAKMIAKYCKWEMPKDTPSSKVSSLGSLYGIDNRSYLFLSQYGDPTDFLDRDFAVIEAVFQKLEFENIRLREIRNQSEKSEAQIQKLISPAELEEVEANLTAIRTYQCHLHNSLSLMARLDQILDIGILDISNYLFSYAPQNDTLFVAKLGKSEKIQKRVRFDLNYLKLISANIDSRVRLLMLSIQSRRLKTERRIETFVAAFGAAVSVGMLTAGVVWTIRVPLMVSAGILSGALSWFPGISKEK